MRERSRDIDEHLHTTRAQLLEYQNTRLRRVVERAYARVPYYRKLFDAAGVDPRSVRNAEDLQKLPITKRGLLQTLPPEELLAAGTHPDRLHLTTTSGSTGRPLLVRYSWLEERVFAAFWGRTMDQYGQRRGDRIAVLGFLPDRRTNPALLSPTALSVPRENYVDCRAGVSAIAAELRRLRPDMIVTYPASLAHVCTEAADELTGVSPRAVVLVGEVATPRMRQQIEETLRTRTFSLYSSQELQCIASECPETGVFHVLEDSVALEVVDERGEPALPGASGTVVATALHSHSMPFVRYELGDLVTRGDTPCACGQPFATLSAVRGRMVDYFRLPSGRSVHPYEISAQMLGLAPWILQYQLVQHEIDRVVLSLVVRRTPSTSELDAVRRGASSALDPDVRLEIVLVERIPFGEGGKFRVARSLVSSVHDVEP